MGKLPPEEIRKKILVEIKWNGYAALGLGVGLLWLAIDHYLISETRLELFLIFGGLSVALISLGIFLLARYRKAK